MRNKTFITLLMSLMLFAMACNKDDIENQGQRIDSLENSMKGIVQQLQSLVFIPEYNDGYIHVDGTKAIILRYRVEPKKLTSKLVEYGKQLALEGKSGTQSPTLSISNYTGDDASGVLTLNVTPGSGFEYNGNYAFSLGFSDNVSSFASAYTPVFVVVHPTAMTVSFVGIQDISQPFIVGNTYQIQAHFTPAYATETGVTWTSSNTDAATIDANGVLTPVNNGKTTITAVSTDNPELKYNVTITITGGDIPVNPDNGTGQDQAE